MAGFDWTPFVETQSYGGDPNAGYETGLPSFPSSRSFVPDSFYYTPNTIEMGESMGGTQVVGYTPRPIPEGLHFNDVFSRVFQDNGFIQGVSKLGDLARIGYLNQLPGFDASTFGPWLAARQSEVADREDALGINSFSQDDFAVMRMLAAIFGGATGTAGTTGGGEAAGAEGGLSAAGGGTAGGEFMPPAILDTGGGSIMPSARPEADPTFGGTLVESSPGLFTPSSGFDSPTVDFGRESTIPLLDEFGSTQEFLMPGAVPEPDPTFGGQLVETGFPGSGIYDNPFSFTERESWWDNLDWRRRLRLGGLGLHGLSALSAHRNARAMGRMADRASEEKPTVIDPFGYGPERSRFLEQLKALMADPKTLENTPGYNAGLQAIMRTMAAQGYLGSGNMMKSLFDYGGKAYGDEISRLTSLAGGGLPLQVMYPNRSAEVAARTAQAGLTSSGLGTAGFAMRALEEIFA